MGRFILNLIIIFNLSLATVFAQVPLAPEDANRLIIDKVAPAYPPLAKATKTEGVVKLDITVSDKGAVTLAKVIDGHPLLKTAALEAARRWKYKPYLLDGKPTPFRTTVEIVFSSNMPAGSTPRGESDPELDVSNRFFHEEGNCRRLYKSQKLQEAEAACKNAAQLADQFTNGRSLERMGIYQLFGRVLLQQKRYQEALDKYSRALEYALVTLEDKNAELGQLYGDLGVAYHALGNLDKAREVYRKAERSLQLAYADMTCDNCDEEVNNIRHEYIRTLKSILDFHEVAARQSGATEEIEQIKRIRKRLP